MQKLIDITLVLYDMLYIPLFIDQREALSKQINEYAPLRITVTVHIVLLKAAGIWYQQYHQYATIQIKRIKLI